jgi:hypothetical protein
MQDADDKKALLSKMAIRIIVLFRKVTPIVHIPLLNVFGMVNIQVS